MATPASKRILVAPLDWGLGHTTRCIPLMRHIRALGHSVVFAGNDRQRRYIEKTFDGIETIHLEGYNVRYSRSGSTFMFSILSRIPRLLKTVRDEHEWLLEQTAKLQIDGIISDNRYGLFHPHKPCVMLTHQLAVRTSLGAAADELLRRLHYKYIARFNECWVVDVPGTPNLSGQLGHPSKLPDSVKYAGLLSQLDDLQPQEGHKLIVLLSGPEPQRSILSAILWKQVVRHDGEVVFIEGSDRVSVPSLIPSHISYHKKITGDTLAPLLAAANMIICRSGYSTLMDIVALGKKAIIIPTPGQTEQEYLGRFLHEEGVFFTAKQKNFNLVKTLHAAKKFPFQKPDLQDAFQLYKPVLKQWLDNI